MRESRDEEPEKENLEMQWENQESGTALHSHGSQGDHFKKENGLMLFPCGYCAWGC